LLQRYSIKIGVEREVTLSFPYTLDEAYYKALEVENLDGLERPHLRPFPVYFLGF